MFRNCLILSLVLSCIILTALAEKTMKVSGSAYEVILSEEVEELADGRTSVIYRGKHLWVAEKTDPDNPMPQRGTCTTVGTEIRETDGTVWLNSINHCQDEEGDSYWLVGDGDQSGGSYRQVRGTGKWHKVKQEGTWKPGVQFSNGTLMSTWETTQTIP